MIEKTKIGRKVILLVLDGWGYAPAWGGNAISIANTRNFDTLWKDFPHVLLGASGADVGLPGHERGNSEVGHLNLGAGRVVYQDNTRIWAAVRDGTFFKNTVLLRAFEHCRKHNSNLHIMGLASEAGVHSHLGHLFALLDLAKQQNFTRVYLHCFTDGRDTLPMDGLSLISKIEKKLKEAGLGEIVTISGRYFAMDRDNHWERTKLAYEAITRGLGNHNESPLAAISSAYKEGTTDEFIKPIVITEKGQPRSLVANNDAVIFFNFRSDRARQLAMAFMAEKFTHFNRKQISNLFFIGMIPYGYEEELKLKLDSAFKPDLIKNTLAEILSENNLYQFHAAETEKYAHVTYFFNGGRENPFENEQRLLVPSPRIASYDLRPEMSIEKIVVETIDRIRKKTFDFMVVNFANPDMVGHTGNLKAAVKACEIVDKQLGLLIKSALECEYATIITADHGNIEQMVDPKTGEIDTEHTKNPVPCIIVSNHGARLSINLLPEGILADVAPTILNIMNLKPPKEMTGKSLIK